MRNEKLFVGVKGSGGHGNRRHVYGGGDEQRRSRKLYNREFTYLLQQEYKIAEEEITMQGQQRNQGVHKFTLKRNRRPVYGKEIEAQ